MNFAELVEERFSVRKFSDTRVTDADLDYILKCARLAPSACNRQPWTIYVAQSEDALSKVKAAYSRDWIANVSTILVVSAHHDASWHRDKSDNKDHADVDMAILADHIILAAQERGVASCWVCAFNPQTLREALCITDANEEPVVMIPLGYAAPGLVAPEKIRKALNDIVVYK